MTTRAALADGTGRRRDSHKMKAFVRFRLTRDEAGGERHYIAWQAAASTVF